MANYLKRYKAGEHRQVWSELLSMGAAVRRPPLYAEAYAVALETMERVGENALILVPRLQSFGFEFGVYPDGAPFPGYRGAHVPPPAGIIERINTVENIVGAIPLSLRAFWETVGSVNLIARPMGKETDDLAPLVVDSIDPVLDEYEEWLEFCCEDGDEETAADAFAISLAPDSLHKDNVSGGEPYSIAIPNPAIDAVVLKERHHTTLVEYLRICMAQGGFSGPGELPVPIEELTRGLLLF
jgi:hypothetical protein